MQTVCRWPSVNILFKNGYGMSHSDAAHAYFILSIFAKFFGVFWDLLAEALFFFVISQQKN
jgi:hypothetical protein